MNRNEASLLCKGIGLRLLDLYSRYLPLNLYGDRYSCFKKFIIFAGGHLQQLDRHLKNLKCVKP